MSEDTPVIEPIVVDVDHADLGANLKRIRESHDLTQRQLDRLTGSGKGVCASIEKGVRNVNPGVYTLYPIALALGCTFEELLGVAPLRDSTKGRVRRRGASLDVGH